MLRKRTEQEKMEQRKVMEKSIFGINLANEQKRWVEENDASNKAFAKNLLYVEPKTVERAIAGQVTSANMEFFATRLGRDAEEMKAVNYENMIRLIKYRFSEEKHRKSMVLALLTVIFMFVAVFTNNIGPTLLTIILAALSLHNITNLWNVKIKIDRKEKSMRFVDGAAIVSAVILVVGICSF